MTHKPISIKNICLSFPTKNSFTGFSSNIYCGDRIAIIGRNGSGKSNLLNMLRGTVETQNGEINIPDDVIMGYTLQTINEYQDLSGGQRFNKSLTKALSIQPNLLLLDEPTNHLDLDNRKSLMRMLQKYQGTLIIVSHDRELLKNCINRLWHIANNNINEFVGSYDEYISLIQQEQQSLQQQLSSLKQAKKDTHNALMKEQSRAKKRKEYGEKKYTGDKLALRAAQGKGQMTANKNKKLINNKKNNLLNQLSDLYIPEIIIPKFSITSDKIISKVIVNISNAMIGYDDKQILLNNINLSVSSRERISINGKNASGKSTLLKAMIGQNNIFKKGNWQLPDVKDIGYLDQHYDNLDSTISVIEHLINNKPNWSREEIRQHLNDFLFRSNEEVNNLISNLSGGEKARLSLCQIAANPPKLLILDEITNNLDIETKEHVIQILKHYPGAMIIVSHEEDFLHDIGININYKIKNGTIYQG